MDSAEQIRLYREQMGEQATMRQIVAAENRYPCCGEYRFNGHHPDCRNAPGRRIDKAYRKLHGDKETKGAA